MTRFWIFIAMVFGLIGYDLGFAQSIHKNQLEDLQGMEFRETIRRSFDSISLIQNYKEKEKRAKEILEQSKDKDVEAYIGALIFNAENFIYNSNALFSKAYSLAEEHDLLDAMCLVEYSRAQYFIERKQYDSAMIYILHYQEMSPEGFEGEGYRNILNLLGDIYYHAGLYFQAEEVYRKMYEAYVLEDNWNFYRSYVMMNNLGQIAIKKQEFDAAQLWFEKSLNKAEKFLKTSYRNNTIAFTKIKLAEVAILKNHLPLAEKYLSEVEDIPEMEKFLDVRQEWTFYKSKLFLKKEQLVQAQTLSKSLLPEENKRSTYRFVPQIYLLYSEILNELGQHQKALKYYKKFNHIIDSLQVKERLSQSMIILADKNHALTQLQLEKSLLTSKVLSLSLLIVVSLLALIILLYFKLYQSKLKLVRRSIDCHSSTHNKTNIDEEVDNEVHNNNNNELLRHRKIIEELKNLMLKDKIYLDPQLSIVGTSKLLSTNRTYLSKAINHELKTTFPNYINEYRIKEAIQLITNGYSENHTQEALAKKSGFANRSVFIAAFKKNTGVLPSFFIENHRKMKRRRKDT